MDCVTKDVGGVRLVTSVEVGLSRLQASHSSLNSLKNFDVLKNQNLSLNSLKTINQVQKHL